ncbi:MAG TPA: hypothetical protein VGC97_05160 [Pyrinomonadaceae bacterium]|jgi:hypothetical protein
MISQKCPKCLSNRVRRGYRSTPFWLKILFRYNLLCDNCNWEFRGFAVPGTVSAKPTKSPKKKPNGRIDENLNNLISLNPLSNLQNVPAAENIVPLDTAPGQNGSISEQKVKRKSGV